MHTKRLFLLLVICIVALLVFTSCDMLTTPQSPGGTDIGVGFDLWQEQVASIEKTGVTNGVATYKITLKNGTEETISVGGMTDKGEITSIEKTAEENGVATYTVTLSDGTSQTLTVTDKTTPPVTSAPAGDLNSATLEQLLALLETNKIPILDEDSTVTDASKTTAAGAFKNGVVGFTTYMTKDIFFGDADTVCKITLKNFSLEAVTKDEIAVYVEFRKIDTTTRPNDNSAVTHSKLIATYEAFVTPDGLGDYELDLGSIDKDDLSELGDAFILGIYTNEENPVRMSFSKNPTCLMAEKNALTNTTNASAFRYSYYYKNVGGNLTTASADEALMPELTFLHTEEPKYMLESELIEKIKELIAAGGVGNNGGSTGGTVTPGVVPTAGLKLHLPDYYDLVVGDNFELFYKGIAECYDSDVYDFVLRYADYKGNSAADNRGQVFARKYVWTPTEADAGKTYTLNITVYDNVGSIVATDSVEIRVHAKPTSPEEEKVVLCVGDSLTNGGTWVKQFYDRLCANNGDKLENIKFIGTRQVVGTKVYYEGYGGWSFASYTGTSSNRDNAKYIVGSFTDKNEAEDQHSVYKDENGSWWKLESIENNQIKLIWVDGGATSKNLTVGGAAGGGTLTWVSGGVNHDPITFSNWSKAPSNPMWDDDINGVNMKKYVEGFGVDHLDEVYVLLGWNNTGTTEEKYKQEARTFLDNILTVYPDCHITLMGLQVPLKDGFASNYNMGWPYFEKAGHVWLMQEWYMEICEEAKYKDNLSFIQISGQFDSINNCMQTTVVANNHSTVKETICSNGVHPAAAGYKQIGDAAYRHFVSRLQE